ncbi:hypothetical protein OESDEN_17414 [Oesophagostomum dentatum]|uniref:Uncharacterized protein n=1 Tax=Oesophagostomum dentatum TaxID=61180 RepID=A0A0B1SG61_OESDE|nr:hypothetical protein OESDEN_17414 [Oesophagostomum dentatum]
MHAEPSEPEPLGEPAEPAAHSGDIMDQVFSALPNMAPVEIVVESPEPETLERVEELPQEDLVGRRSTHESGVDAEAAPHYVPTYQTQRQEAPPTTQVSPPSNGSSLNGYPTSNDSGKCHLCKLPSV